jgi:DNA mismatch repair ATPase MutS
VVELFVFILLIKKWYQFTSELSKLKQLIRINDNEIEALSGKMDMFHEGSEYIDKSHPFTYDLDVFGESSLFCFINRTCTISGKNKLAGHLSVIEQNRKTIKDRQHAVEELKNDPDWCQNFIAEALSCYDFSSEKNETIDQTEKRLINWSSDKSFFKHKTFVRIMTILLPAFVFVSLLANFFGLMPYAITFLFVSVNLAVVGLFLKRINIEHERLGKQVKAIMKTEILINLIENKTFTSDNLKNLRNRLGENHKSSRIIRQLYKILQAFDQRLNILAGVLLNGFVLWDLQILLKLERIKEFVQLKVQKWFDVVGEFDSMISLSIFAFNHPNFVFPEFSDEAFTLSTKEVGHPLIQKDKRKTNNFEISGLHKIIIITGANMAGKSTFLRTININMILGACGAPVCATYFKFNPIPLFTSIRTDDSLSKNESYFFAELMRLKRITDELKSRKTLFITLDEMLKGTNSKDKHLGSYALIEQLIRYNAVGIVATHDIALGELSGVYPKNIENKCFEAEIIGDELQFDYRLRDGISQNFNATFLMQKFGITK